MSFGENCTDCYGLKPSLRLWSTGLAESALTVASAFCHAVTTNEEKKYGGIFGILYTDGGTGNKAKINTVELAEIFLRLRND